MQDISKYIHYFSSIYRKNCSHWDKSEKACTNKGGCICAKFGEVQGHIRSLIQPNYRNATIYDYTGTLEKPDGEVVRVVSVEDVEHIQDQMWKFLYGDAPFQEDLTRPELNALSVLDDRFKRGECLVIHGDARRQSKYEKMHMQERMPTGKSFLASIATIDAIWRRCFITNTAITYDWASFLKMRILLKTRYIEEHQEVEEAKESDFLVIDDINTISGEFGDKAANWTREKLDNFLMYRMDHHKPTILVCNFDVEKVDLPGHMGDAFDKLVYSSGTTRIRVEPASQSLRGS
tara:strand:+ start:47292 stop:48164 length:873 start_codon:yes stop_codon:yes gene_type:complete